MPIDIGKIGEVGGPTQEKIDSTAQTFIELLEAGGILNLDSNNALMVATRQSIDAIFSSITPYAKGAAGDWNGTTGTDDTIAIQAAFDEPNRDVYIPAGKRYRCTSTIILSIPKRIWGGGELVFTAGVFSAAGIQVTANDVTISDIILTNGSGVGSDAGNRQYGIEILANDSGVLGATIDSFQTGIAVRASGEFYNSRIIGCKIKNVWGVALEDRGDGIVVWGAQATIIGNIVSAKTGTDPRIGIHVERLADFRTTDAPHNDSLHTIGNNVIYGQFRRGIICEGCAHVAINANTVADSTWHAIGIVTGARAVVATGNTIIWTRKATDLQGDSWGPNRCPIIFYGDVRHCSAADNIIHVAPGGVAESYIRAVGTSFQNRPTDCVIRDNLCYCSALASFSVTSGTLGGGNQITTITIGATSLIAAPVAHTGSQSGTANAIATAITALAETSLYYALAIGSTVYIWAHRAGPLHNGQVLTVTPGGTATVGSVTNLSGGLVTNGFDVAGQAESILWEGNDVYGFSAKGWSGFGTKRPRVKGNLFDGIDVQATDGIQTSVATTFVDVRDNTIKNINGDGIEIANQSGAIIEGNLIENCVYGINLSGSTNSEATKNKFRGTFTARIRNATGTGNKVRDNEGQFIRQTFTFNPGPLVVGATENLDLAVPGLAFGDTVSVNLAYTLGGLELSWLILATDSLRITVKNPVPEPTRTLFTWNPALIAAGASVSTDITVTGAAFGDEVVASLAYALEGHILRAEVSAVDTVRVTLTNPTAGALPDLASSSSHAIYLRKWGSSIDRPNSSAHVLIVEKTGNLT